MEIIILFIYLTNVKNISKSVLDSLRKCYNTVIPTLFPTLLISNLLIGINKSHDGKRGKIFDILGNCKIYSIHILTGMLCGFISGPKAICEDYQNKKTDEQTITNSVALSSNAGLGFIIGTVGITLYNDFKFGIYLYFSQIASALVTFLIFKRKARINYEESYTNEKINLSKIILKAVTSAIHSMLIICSFSILANAIISIITDNLNFNYIFEVFLFSFFDFSSAIFKIQGLNNEILKLFLIGFSIGFAGISVHLQTFSVCEGCPLNKFKFFIFKLIQAILCGICSTLFILIWFLKITLDF